MEERREERRDRECITGKKKLDVISKLMELTPASIPTQTLERTWWVGYEPQRNERFIIWLRHNLGSIYQVSADEKSNTPFYYSRSKQDFKIIDSGVNMKAAAITIAE